METTATNGANEMTQSEMVETIRQMLNDWNSATPEQRAEAQAIAAELAAKRYAEILINEAVGVELNWK